MKYSKNTYMKALAALAALRTTLSEKEQHTVDFVAEAITEKADRDTRPATHADRIRGMNDEELAEFIDEISGFQADYLQYRGEFIDAGDVLAWLRREVHDGQT